MLDTYLKDGHRLTDNMSTDELKSFVDKSHDYNLKIALTDPVNKNDIHY